MTLTANGTSDAELGVQFLRMCASVSGLSRAFDGHEASRANVEASAVTRVSNGTTSRTPPSAALVGAYYPCNACVRDLAFPERGDVCKHVNTFVLRLSSCKLVARLSVERASLPGPERVSESCCKSY